MTPYKFRLIVYPITFFCLTLVIMSGFIFDILEAETAFEIAFKYTFLPVAPASLPLSYFIYIKIYRQEDLSKYKSRFRANLNLIVQPISMAIVSTILITSTTFSLIVLSNAWLGKQEKTSLQGVVLTHKRGDNKARHYHHIQVQDDNSDKIFHLRTFKAYRPGEPFSTRVYKGKWGLVYTYKIKTRGKL